MCVVHPSVGHTGDEPVGELGLLVRLVARGTDAAPRPERWSSGRRRRPRRGTTLRRRPRRRTAPRFVAPSAGPRKRGRRPPRRADAIEATSHEQVVASDRPSSRRALGLLSGLVRCIERRPGRRLLCRLRLGIERWAGRHLGHLLHHHCIVRGLQHRLGPATSSMNAQMTSGSVHGERMKTTWAPRQREVRADGAPQHDSRCSDRSTS